MNRCGEETIHANRAASYVRLEKRVADIQSRLAEKHGFLAREARRYVMTAWLPRGRKDGEKEDFLSGSVPHLRLANMRVQ